MSSKVKSTTTQTFKKIVMRAVLVAATFGAFGTFTAENASAHGFVYIGGGNCPYGTHLGYRGKHCWSNYRYYGPSRIGFGFGFGFGHGYGVKQSPPVRVLSQ